MTVTQTDDWEPPPHNIAAPRGYRVWLIEWTEAKNDRESTSEVVDYSINSARRLTQNLLKMRPPGTSVEEVFTLVRFTGGYKGITLTG